MFMLVCINGAVVLSVELLKMFCMIYFFYPSNVNSADVRDVTHVTDDFDSTNFSSV